MIEVKVVSKKIVAEDICLFELAHIDGSALPPFSAGAHIDVEIPGGIIRQYSLCNPAGENHTYQIAVLKDPTSRGGSLAMHLQVNSGDRIKISEPKNHFPLTNGATRSLLFAGGIGITPILCMAERLAHSGADFELHYCTRSPAKTAFMERIQASPFAEHTHFHFDDGIAEQKIDAASILASPKAGVHVYVCGPGGFMEHILKTAEENNWSTKQLHREYFAAGPIDSSHSGSFEVEIGSTGQILEIPANKTVIEVLETFDIEIPFSCESGVCGTCVTRVLDGIPDHRDFFLTEEEKAQNNIFTPCCSRAKSSRLVLDI
ncbi:PDR/VanB family oxidoreductase [Paraglaciecola chathamensis]|uniref:Vanillate monooxygenase n=1 Tax=Paraglaciecola agarilytica NO2 TaxID=1125747 RepID=A0ABQ0IAX8_9ALTE|nr:PDR/VanB family oxidoreductase [Paraglaciecola agarilytica]GAC06432.1 vanillate monooxygenase [Paraglaciecola agarilytica NO2]